MPSTNPAVQRRRLGRALKGLRDASGLTGDVAGAAVGRSAPWISRVESGHVNLRARDLRSLLDLYGVEDLRVRVELESLADAGRQEAWWSQYRASIPEPYGVLIDLEGEATALRIYESVAVPGLLQTQAYAKALFESSTPPLDPQVVEDRIAVRMARQEILRRTNPPNLDVLVEEAVIRRSFGDTSVFIDQLRALERLSEQPAITIRVIPFDRTVVAYGEPSFAIMEFNDLPKVSYIEDRAGGSIADGQRVDLHEQLFDALSFSALAAQESVELIRKAFE